MSENSLAVFGSFISTSWNLVKSISEKFKKPFITWADHEKEANINNRQQLYMRPLIVPALLKFIKHCKITSDFYYIYNDEQGDRLSDQKLTFLNCFKSFQLK